MKNKYVKIEGIHCNHCIDLITKELLKNKNIKEVKIKNNIAHIKYEKKLTNKEIIKIITNIDYITKDEYISDNLKDIDNKIRVKEFIIIISKLELNYFNIEKELVVGDNIIEFTPTKEGTYTYTCWMNMIKNILKVKNNEKSNIKN